MTVNIKQVFEVYQNKQLDVLEQARQIAAKINEFTCVEFSANTSLSDFDKLKNVLYFFELPQHIHLTQEEICKKIQTEKDNNKQLKLPKVNHNVCNAENKILYVGKSSGNFATRLKHHQGKISKSTYALHLNEWSRIFDQDLTLLLHFVSLENIIGNQTDILEIIETSLHYYLTPLLGRSGH